VRSCYADLGPTFYDTRISNSRKMRDHVRQLDALGYTVTLTRPPEPGRSHQRAGEAGSVGVAAPTCGPVLLIL
jgi:hypothetical protein